MKRQKVIDKLRAHTPELRRMGVKSLALFGSLARDEAGPAGDVDLLVEFDRPVGLFQFYTVEGKLKDILGVEAIDLVMRDAVIEELQDTIFAEAVPCL